MIYFVLLFQILSFLAIVVLFIKQFFYNDIEKIEQSIKPQTNDIRAIFDITTQIEEDITTIKNSVSETKSLPEIFNFNNYYDILFHAPYDGYLTIEADLCELYLFNDSQLIVKNRLEKFFIPKLKSISIRNIKNLKNLRFDKNS